MKGFNFSWWCDLGRCVGELLLMTGRFGGNRYSSFRGGGIQGSVRYSPINVHFVFVRLYLHVVIG